MPSFPIQLKRNGTAAATPSSLLHGEVALNYADGKLFWKDASNVIQSFTFQAYALSSHTHAASDITSGTLDAARLPLATTIAAGAVIVGTGLGVSSGTVSVTYGTSAGTACQGNDSRLSDTRTPTDGSVTTAKLANDAVTYAKIQNVSATDRLLGRSSAGSGDVEEITCTAFGRSLIGSADAAAARTTLSVQPTASPAFQGTVSAAAANFTGAVSVTSPLTLTGTVAGNVRQIKMQTSGVDRWQITPSFDAETGSNAGSNLHITRWSDAGSFMGTPLYITRSTGVVNCESGLTIVSGQLLVTAGSVSAPGVAFSGDTNTGFYSPAADQVAVTTNGILRFYTDSPTNRSRIIVNRQDQSLVLGSYWESGVGQNSYISSTNTALTGDSSLLLQTGTTTRLTIGFDGSLTAPDVYGDTVGATNRDLFIDSGGLIGYVSSIRASKTNIAAIDDVSWLRDLTPVSFHYRKRNEDGTYSDEADGTLDYGLIAEEVEPVAPEMCFYDVVDGEPQLRGVHYSKLITPMLRYIQQLEARIAALEERVNA